MAKKKKRKKTKSEAQEEREKRQEKRKTHVAFLTKHDMLSYARSHPSDTCGKGKCSSYNDGPAPATMSGQGEAAVHHVLPVSAVVTFMKKYQGDELEHIASVYGQLKWCINLNDNLIHLPYFPAYQRFINRGGAVPVGLAAHNFDHPTYTQAVVDLLKPSWDSMKGKNPAKPCKKAEELSATLTKLIGEFKPDLNGRGMQSILEKARQIKANGKQKSKSDIDGLVSSSWWKEFSMYPSKAKERSISLLLAGRLSPAVRAAITRS